MKRKTWLKSINLLNPFRISNFWNISKVPEILQTAAGCSPSLWCSFDTFDIEIFDFNWFPLENLDCILINFLQFRFHENLQRSLSHYRVQVEKVMLWICKELVRHSSWKQQIKLITGELSSFIIFFVTNNAHSSHTSLRILLDERMKDLFPFYEM